jgi:hypothetical protein
MFRSIRRVVSAALVPTLALALVARPSCASAEDVGTFMAAVRAANEKVASMVVDLTPKDATSGIAIHVVTVRPDRMSITIRTAFVSAETRFIGDQAYTIAPGGSWRKLANQPARVRTVLADLVDANQAVALLPDVVLEGKTYHRYSSTPRDVAAIGERTVVVTTTCLVDAASFRLASCDNMNVHMAFSRYDDPANVVDVPVIPRNAPPPSDDEQRGMRIHPAASAPPEPTPTAAGPRAPQGG